MRGGGGTTCVGGNDRLIGGRSRAPLSPGHRAAGRTPSLRW